MFIDTHAHLNFKAFKTDLDKVIKKSVDVGVRKIINVGSNYATSVKAVESVKNVETVENVKMYAAVGLHPIHLASDITESEIIDAKEYKFTTKQEKFNYQKYAGLIRSSDKIVAIGETGLDYFRIKSEIRNPKSETNSKFEIQTIKTIQKKVFMEHIRLAEEFDLPLILHCRGSKEKPDEAYEEILKILKCHSEFISESQRSRNKFEMTHDLCNNLQGVIHCFVGNLKQAYDFINLGFFIGVNGIVTFNKSNELQDIVKKIPLKSILLETDCPYLAPEPYRGKRNTPEYISLIAQKIARIKNIKLKKVEDITTQNAKNLFNI